MKNDEKTRKMIKNRYPPQKGGDPPLFWGGRSPLFPYGQTLRSTFLPPFVQVPPSPPHFWGGYPPQNMKKRRKMMKNDQKQHFHRFLIKKHVFSSKKWQNFVSECKIFVSGTIDRHKMSIGKFVRMSVYSCVGGSKNPPTQNFYPSPILTPPRDFRSKKPKESNKPETGLLESYGFFCPKPWGRVKARLAEHRSFVGPPRFAATERLACSPSSSTRSGASHRRFTSLLHHRLQSYTAIHINNCFMNQKLRFVTSWINKHRFVS